MRVGLSKPRAWTVNHSVFSVLTDASCRAARSRRSPLVRRRTTGRGSGARSVVGAIENTRGGEAPADTLAPSHGTGTRPH